jgi:predicted phosphodiesterase
VRRTVILSDLHMGRPHHGVADPEMLRPLWRGANELILNGDSAEVHDRLYRARAARMMLRLQDLCEADRVHLAVLSGNHDPLITDRRYLRLHGGEVFVCHGDMLHPAISPWTAHADRLTALHDEARASLDPDTADSLDGRLGISQHTSSRHWDDLADLPHGPPPSAVRETLGKGVKLAKVAWYWQTLPQRAIRFARRYVPESRFFIFGHIHRAGIWQDADRRLINTGAYASPARPRAVVIDKGVLRVHRVLKRDATYHLADRPLAAFPLRQRLDDGPPPDAFADHAA